MSRVSLQRLDREAIASLRTISDQSSCGTVAHPASASPHPAPSSTVPPLRAQQLPQPLPARDHGDSLVNAIRASAVTLVQGATGCGKSTQLPQLLLEDAAARAKPFACIIAQPRRLAATALAERVASELADCGLPGGLGGLCGYQIRGEARVCQETRITFVTCGVLLRLIEGLSRVGSSRDFGCESPLEPGPFSYSRPQPDSMPR
jgi:hypothetical protein